MITTRGLNKCQKHGENMENQMENENQMKWTVGIYTCYDDRTWESNSLPKSPKPNMI